jgi:hypothetical protein
MAVCRHLSRSMAVCRYVSRSMALCRYVSRSMALCRHLSRSMALYRYVSGSMALQTRASRLPVHTFTYTVQHKHVHRQCRDTLPSPLYAVDSVVTVVRFVLNKRHQGHPNSVSTGPHDENPTCMRASVLSY